MDKEIFSDYLNRIMEIEGEGSKTNIDEIPKGSNILMPITYITPNYLSLRAMSAVSALTNLDCYVTILLHDSNLIMHKSVLGNKQIVKELSIGVYTQHLVDEIKALLKIFKAKQKNVCILKFSELWPKIMQDYETYFDFYTILGKLTITNKDIENGLYEEFYHLLERPFDLYVSKNYSKLAKNEFQQPKYFLIPKQRAQSYAKVRDTLNGESDKEKGTDGIKFLSIKNVPSINYNDTLPSCNMSYSQIKQLVSKANLNGEEIERFYELFISPFYKISSALIKEINTEKIKSKKPNDEKELSYILYELFKPIGKKLESIDSNEDTSYNLNVISYMQLEQLRKMLSSNRMVNILKFCNGEFTVSEIAKKTNLQVSNASLYISKLREIGIISTSKRPALKVKNLLISMKMLTEAA